MNIIYITGESHSGTTLLTLLLGRHSRLFAAGELDVLSEERRRSRYRKYQANTARFPNRQHPRYTAHLDAPCMCGAAIVRACPVWSKVDARLRARPGVRLDDLDLQATDDRRFARDNNAVLAAISEVAGTEWVIDSSKKTTRLHRLMALPNINVLPIHLTRSPHGVIFSNIKKYRPWLTSTLRYTRSEWARRAFLTRHPHLELRYEDLATAPGATLRRLVHALNLPFEPAPRDWAQHDHHLIAGNDMRFSTDSTVTLDTSWRQGLAWYQKATIALCTAPLRWRPPSHRERLPIGEAAGDDTT